MGEMMWCKYCSRNCIVHRMHSNGYICCVECGRVLEQDRFKEGVNFTKGPGGECQADGSFVNSVESDLKESFKRTLNKGRKHIQKLAVMLDMNDENLIKQANQFYRIVIERYKFTGGRNTEHVAGACLYIACRANNKPYLLIDFAISLGVNVYVLGAVYLKLCILLSFQNHGFVQTIVDPSLFMHRFTYDLLKDKSNKVKKMVLKTALLIVASMKRDWMQTGRKPSGICGAALYIATLSHGYTYSKTEIMKRVHICEATLTGRLIEFEKTSSGSLTIEEFTQKAKEFEMEKCSGEMSKGKDDKSDEMKLICKHKDRKPHFAHGLCKGCYEEFIEISGGLSGGSEPPSFQVAEMERLARASAEKEGCSVDVNDEVGENACNTKKGVVPEAERTSMPGNVEAECNDSTYNGKIPSVDETENLSDIDDTELNCYFASKEESRLKKIIWEEMNKEYLQEQAAKEAVAAAYMKDLGDAPEDVLQARKLAYEANAALKKKREQRRRKREEENANTPQTAAEATRQMLQKRGLSSKINYDNLDSLFDDDLPLNTEKVDAQPQDDSNITAAKRAKTEKNENGAKERALDEEEENDETIEDSKEEEEEEEEETYEHATYDQNEYYDDEDDSFYD